MWKSLCVARVCPACLRAALVICSNGSELAHRVADARLYSTLICQTAGNTLGFVVWETLLIAGLLSC